MLKKKSRIRLRDAAVLIGVIDLESNLTCVNENEEVKMQEIDDEELLQDGEIFCQIEPSSFSNDV